MQGISGLFSILLIAYAFSEARKAILFKPIIIAVLIHFTLTIIFLKLPFFKEVFLLLNQFVLILETATMTHEFCLWLSGGRQCAF